MIRLNNIGILKRFCEELRKDSAGIRSMMKMGVKKLVTFLTLFFKI